MIDLETITEVTSWMAKEYLPIPTSFCHIRENTFARGCAARTEKSRTEIGAALGISRHMLHGLLTEKHAVTAEMAVRLGYVLGNGPEIWMGLQQAYDLWHAERNVDISKLRLLRKPAEAA